MDHRDSEQERQVMENTEGADAIVHRVKDTNGIQSGFPTYCCDIRMQIIVSCNYTAFIIAQKKLGSVTFYK